ncbi:MAG: hypothetical protein GY854_30490 [Deltaproteobacteria bacterium]|nr:hypothetical protein [Deltaproteobacteria bacterium]
MKHALSRSTPLVATYFFICLSCADQKTQPHIAEKQATSQKAAQLEADIERAKKMARENDRLAQKSKTDSMQRRIQQRNLSTWIESNFEAISRNLAHFYCLEKPHARTPQTRPKSIRISAIITDRRRSESLDGVRNGTRFSNNKWVIDLKITHPKKYRGKQISLAAWRSHPGPRPSWMNGSEVGNLIEFTFADTHLKKKWQKPLDLNLANISVTSHRSLCVRPEGDGQ